MRIGTIKQNIRLRADVKLEMQDFVTLICTGLQNGQSS